MQLNNKCAGVYDPSRHRYDHHQKGFTETFDDAHTTKLSSSGLIWKHFGLDIIRHMCPDLSHDDMAEVFVRLYNTFFESIDGIDNGVNITRSDAPPAYLIKTDLSSRIGRLNPHWNEDGVDVTERFHRAMRLAEIEFNDLLRECLDSWLPARNLVVNALANRTSPEIVQFDTYVPFADHLLELEKTPGEVLFAIFPGHDSWRVRAGAFVRVWEGELCILSSSSVGMKV